METKPGYKTSEFWLSLAAILIAAALGAGFFGPDDPLFKVLTMVATVLGALGYTGARSAVKVQGIKADAIKEASKAVDSNP